MNSRGSSEASREREVAETYIQNDIYERISSFRPPSREPVASGDGNVKRMGELFENGPSQPSDAWEMASFRDYWNAVLEYESESAAALVICLRNLRYWESFGSVPAEKRAADVRAHIERNWGHKVGRMGKANLDHAAHRLSLRFDLLSPEARQI